MKRMSLRWILFAALLLALAAGASAVASLLQAGQMRRATSQVSTGPRPAIGARTPAEHAAASLLTLAGRAEWEGALALLEAPPDDALRFRLERQQVRPVSAAALPAPAGALTPVLVWTEYRQERADAAGPYLVQVNGGGRVEMLHGPLVPRGGYQALSFDLLDESGARLPPRAWQGRPLLLVAPRAPEPGLDVALTELERMAAPLGITVALLIDLRAPDWAGTARAAGFTGPVWRAKADLERQPVVTPGRLLGAAGLLIDPQGRPVAALTALDPLRYGLPGQSPAQLAPQVLRAYRLLP